MNNEWNDEVVVDVNESDITVDQAYNASSSNPQSGTAVAQAVAQAGGTVDQQYNASSTNAQSGTAVAGAIAGVKQVPASTSADADKVLTVNSEGVPGWAQAASGGATWTTTQYTTGATVNQGTINIPLDDPLPVKAGPNLFAVWFRAQLQNGVTTGNYSIRVKVGTNAYTDAIVYMTSNSTDVYGKVVIAGVWSTVPSTLPQTLSLFPNGNAGGGFVATGIVSATVSLLN